MDPTQDTHDNLIRMSKRLYLLISSHIEDELRAYGLARSQFQVIYFIHRAGRLTQKELQQAMQVKAATLTRIVDALTRKGLVTRTENRLDKRSNVLRLTGKGTRLAEKIPALHDVIEAMMFTDFSAAEKDELHRLVAKMINNLES